MSEFYEFQQIAKSRLRTRSKVIDLYDDKIKQKINNFIRHHQGAVELVVERLDECMKIIPKNRTFQSDRISSSSIKQELVDIKVEPSEDNQHEFLQFCRSFGDSASTSFQSDESTTSTGGESSAVQRSRLPAFEQDTYFDGNRFVLKTEVPPKVMTKENRKRQRKPEQWEVNVQKQLKNAGKRYRSTKGYVVAEKSMGSPCDCRKLCSSKINEKNRLTNFNSYWMLDSVQKKRTFIRDHIEVGKPIKAKNEPKHRGVSKLLHHFLSISNSDGTEEKIRVCKRMFLSTLGISNTVITTTLKLNHSQY